MIEFGQKLVEGFGAAGLVMGLMIGLGLFLLIVGTIGYAVLSVLDRDDEEEQEENT